MTENPYRIHIRHGDFELDVEGDRAFVESYIEAFLTEGAIPEPGEDEESPRELPGKAEQVVKGKAKGGARRKGEPLVSPADLKAFMKGKSPVGNKQRYLEYIRFWKASGVDEVSDAHMRACYMAEGLEIPPTGRQHFTSLRKEGVLTPGSGRGLWTLAEESRKPAEKPKKAAKKAGGRKGRGPAAKKAAAKKPAAAKGKVEPPKKGKIKEKKGQGPHKKAKGKKGAKAAKSQVARMTEAVQEAPPAD